MKLTRRIKWIWVFGIVLFTFSAYQIMAVDKTPRQHYKTVFQDGDLEIRFYPSAHLARVKKTGNFEESRYAGFRTLAGYIFGGNAASQKIAMTAPVIYHHDTEANVADMAFVMPDEVEPGKQPNPNSQEVFFEVTQPAYYAVVSRGGWPSQKAMQKMEKKLIEALEQKNLKTDGEFEYRYYNSPFEIFNRLTEVSIRIANYQE